MFSRLGLNRNLAIICVTMFINVFARFTWDSILPLHLRALGADAQQIGLAFTAILIARTLFSIVGGALGDHWGRVRLMGSATMMMGLCYALAGAANDLTLVVIALIAANAFSSIQWPPLSALITESSGEENAARSYSFSETAILFGLILGPVAGAALLESTAMPTLILSGGLVTFFIGIVRLTIVRETVHRTRTGLRANLHAALDTNLVWVIAMGALVAFGNTIIFGPFFAILARDVWHNSEAEINLLFAAGAVASLAGVLIGRLSTHGRARVILAASAVGLAICASWWGISSSWQAGIVPLLLAFLFSEAIIIAQQTIQAAITTRETRASIYGLLSTTTGVIGGLGPTIGAWLVAFGGDAAPFIAAGIANVIVALTIIPIKPPRS